MSKLDSENDPSAQPETKPADTHAPKPRKRSRLWRWFRILLILYLLIMLAAVLGQKYIAFPGAMIPAPAAKFVAPNGGQALWLKLSDGTQVAALFCRAFDDQGVPVTRPADYPTVIYFYGNAQCIAYSQYEVDLYRRSGANVLVADYPGFGLSSGTPTEPGFYALGDTLWHYTQTSDQINPRRVYAVGWSLGGAMAIDLASRYPVAGLMTLSTFTSMPEVAQHRFPFLPTSILLRYRFPNAEKIATVTCPTTIVHGDDDISVPFSMAARLQAASGATWLRYVPLPECGHNDAYLGGYNTIQQAFKSLLTAAEPGMQTSAQTPAPAPAGNSSVR